MSIELNARAIQPPCRAGKHQFWLSLLIALAWFLPAQAAESLAWQSMENYRAPNAAAFFPDDVEAGGRLDALWLDKDRDTRPDDEILRTVRTGLRRTQQHRTVILRWIGNRFIWGVTPQNSEAIELMYHAADFSGEHSDALGTRHFAVYFGLSVVQPKTPSILRTLAELCLKVDDPNDLSRVEWGVKSQRAEFLAYLKPHLRSDDAAIREKAEIVERIVNGELKAFAWSAERARQRALALHQDKLPELKKALIEGDSKKRAETIQFIERERIALIMDDAFVAAFSACAHDESARVRQAVARLAGTRWIWEAKEQRPEAIDLMLRLSKDRQREVRYDAVYFGLSTVRAKSEAVTRRLVELAFQDREPNLYRRIGWGFKGQPETVTRLLNGYLSGSDETARASAREVYHDLTGQAPPPAVNAKRGQ